MKQFQQQLVKNLNTNFMEQTQDRRIKIGQDEKTLSTDIEKLALKICELKDRKEGFEKQVKELGDNIGKFESELAELLSTEGFEIGTTLKLKNGRVLKIKDFFSASIPSQSSINGAKDIEKQEDLIYRKEQALKWLDDNNLSDIIKNQIAISLDRNENEKAKELAAQLEEQGYQFIKEESVHPMTLKSTLKEAISQGLDVPFDTFSVQTGTLIEIK